MGSLLKIVKAWRPAAAAVLLGALAPASTWAETLPLSAPDAELVQRSKQGYPEADYLLGEFFLGRGAQGDGARALDAYRRSIGTVDQRYGVGNDISPKLFDRLIGALDALPDGTVALEARTYWLDRLLRIDPHAVAAGHAWMGLGTAQSKADHHADAIRSEREARRIFEAEAADDPWNRVWAAAAFFNEGLNLRLLGRADEASAAFAEAADRYRDIRRTAAPEIASQASDFLRPALVSLIELASAKGDNVALAARRNELLGLLRETKPNSEDLANGLFDLGKFYAEGADPAKALPLLDEVRTLRRALNSAPAWIAAIDWERGIAFYNLGDKQKALDAYLQAAGGLDPASQTHDADIAALWGNIAGCQAELKQPEKQRDALVKVVGALRRAKPGSVALADALQTLSDAQGATGQKREAVPAAEEGVAIRRKAQPASVELGGALDGLGRARLALNDLPGAATDFREAIAVSLRADPKTKGNAIASRVMLGITLYNDHRYDEAISELDGALAWTRTVEQPNPFNTAVVLGNLAFFSFQIGHFAEAEESYIRQIAILREIRPGSAELAWAVRGLALTYYFLARFEEALPAIRESEALFRAAQGDKGTDYLDTVRQEGWMLEGAGRLDEALKVHAASAEGSAAAEGRDSIAYASAISGHAWTLRRLNRLQESETEMQTALSIFEQKLGPADQTTATGCVNLALLKQLLGHNEEAVKLGLRALSIFNRDARANYDGLRWSYEVLSLAFRDMGDRKRAILFAKQAINVQQKLRSFNKTFSKEQMTGFRSQWRRLYDNLADMLITEGRISEAQSVLAMEKEEELVNFIQRDASADTRDTSAALTPREDAEKSKVDAIVSGPMADAAAVTALIQKRDAGGLSADEDARLTKLQSALDDSYAQFMDGVDAFLASTEGETTGVQKEVEAINLDYTADIQEELRAFNGDAVMLQIASLGDATHLFLTGPEASVHRQVQIKRQDLARLVFGALNAVQNRDPAADAQLRKLYDVLVAPVAADLKASGAKTVMLNLQGFLRYVPFAALTDGKRYLVEDYALSLYTPAAKTEFKLAGRAPDKSAGFGVTVAHPGFAALPGVAQEIGAIFGGNGALGALSGAASLDDKFTRDTFQAALKARPAIIHIASHFKLVPGRETDSFLLLGDGSSLSLADIRRGRGFRFGGVDLLTLSACETARGADGEGDEFESFGALAQMNGASAVMATLWPVADEETAALMRSFYLHMMTPGITKAEALREAQLEAIHGATAAMAATSDRGAVSLISTARKPIGSSHPYFWSPFVLMGNWM